ncbi:MAG: ribbon-helix-helix protein, CopG family [Calditrichaeota bacterium]|nr:MAG: ribbon-helix-helix protein, CopG family [Calditrichota bacterium]
MKTVQMTIDENLLLEVDKLAQKLGTTRSAFTRIALREAIQKIQIKFLEEKHRKGYEKYPVGKDEFPDWNDEGIWSD